MAYLGGLRGLVDGALGVHCVLWTAVRIDVRGGWDVRTLVLLSCVSAASARSRRVWSMCFCSAPASLMMDASSFRFSGFGEGVEGLPKCGMVRGLSERRARGEASC